MNFEDLISAPVEFMGTYGIPFIVVLSVLVFVHEWGHYIVARMCGVKVVTFSIGFGKEIFGRTDKNGTRWQFSLVPLGGYVQMFGDSDPASSQATTEVVEGVEPARPMTEEERKVAFFSKSLWQRSAIVAAGPAINFIFAIILLMGLYIANGQPYTPPVAASIIEGNPADLAGIKPDDRIVKVDNTDITSFSDLQKVVSLNFDKEMVFHVKSYIGDNQWGDEIRELSIKPKKVELEDRFGFKHTKGLIGIESPAGSKEIIEHGLGSSFIAANVETYQIVKNSLKAIKQIITGARSAEELGGIIRIGAYAGEFANAGIVSLITFMALLSINLGFINLLPIPLLDGGHLAFYAAEAVKGSPVGERGQEYAFRMGFAFIIGIMLFATWNDLVQLNVIDYLVNFVS